MDDNRKHKDGNDEQSTLSKKMPNPLWFFHRCPGVPMFSGNNSWQTELAKGTRELTEDSEDVTANVYVAVHQTLVFGRLGGSEDFL